MRPVTIEDGRVVTHGDAELEAMHRAIHDGAAFLEECGRDLMAASAHAAFRRLGIVTGDWETVDAARLYTFALKSALATAETALADRDRHFLWDDRLRVEREAGDLATRLATAEAERDQWRARAEWLSTSTDEVCYVEPVGDYEGGWHILAVPGFYATRWEAIDAAIRRAPSTGTTPP